MAAIPDDQKAWKDVGQMLTAAQSYRNTQTPLQ